MNKDTLEKIVGYEINDFKEEIVYDENNNIIGVSYMIVPRQKIENINIEIKINNNE